MRRAAIATVLGIMGFAVAAILGAPNWIVVIIGLLGLAVAASTSSLVGLRCPRCRNRIGQLLVSVGGPFFVSPSLRCCLFCAVEFDSELSISEPSNKPLQPTRATSAFKPREPARFGPRG
jgi:hypothetical protein